MPSSHQFTIPLDKYPRLISALEVGSSIAEDDVLLHEARVETSVSSQILTDRVDIVRGTKGSGKSALFRIVTDFLADWILTNESIVILKGAEASGDPIFLQFKPQFEQLDEVDFQNFWRIYFLSLVNSQFLTNPAYAKYLASAGTELKKFKKLAKTNGFPVLDRQFSLAGLVGWALSKLPRPKRFAVTYRETETSVELGAPSEQQEEKTPLFVAALHEALVELLNKCGIKLWLMLDRLDEVFPRRSAVERLALRGLLRTTLGFRDERVRIKIFLRDDIFDSVTEVSGGFPALTHVVSRCSDTLWWSREQILHLIINRVYASTVLRDYFNVDIENLKKSPQHRALAFNKIFPDKIRRGTNQSQTLDWIYKHCEDANGVVTPRDVIDLITFAKGYQQDAFHSNPIEMQSLLSPASILYGHRRMSEKKKETYFKAEFDHFWKDIEKFENKKAEHDKQSMRQILGEEWKSITKDLRSIGFLKFNPRSDTYTIPFLYRHCLRIRQGKGFAGNC